MLRTAILAALALVALASSAHARPHHDKRYGGLDPLCNVTMPCAVPEHSLLDGALAASTRTPIERLRRMQHRSSRALGVSAAGWQGFGGAGLVATARRYLGAGAIFGRRSLWCARFLNVVLDRAGYGGTGSDLARSFASFGSPAARPQVGAIAVMSRRGGGHVGIVTGFDARGNPIVISGNHGRRVAEAVYPAGRVYAYRVP